MGLRRCPVLEGGRRGKLPDEIPKVELPPDRVAVVGNRMGRTGRNGEWVKVVAGMRWQVAQFGDRVRRARALGKGCVSMKVFQALLLRTVERVSQEVLSVYALPVHRSEPAGLVVRSLPEVGAPKGEAEGCEGKVTVDRLREGCLKEM